MSEQYEELHAFDTRNVQKISEIVSAKEYKLFCTMPSTFTLCVSPNKVTYNQLQQISMSNSRLISTTFDLNKKTMVCKSWKNGKEKKVSKKRKNYSGRSENASESRVAIPDTIHFADKPQIESILHSLTSHTKLEFDVKFDDKPTKYILGVELKEKFTKSLLDVIIEKTGSFIDSIVVDFTKEKLFFHVVRNDCSQTSKKRQRL